SPTSFAAAKGGADKHDSCTAGQATTAHTPPRTKAEEEELIYGRASNPRSTIYGATATVAGEVHAGGAQDARRRSHFRADEQDDRGPDDHARAASEVRQDCETGPKILRAR